MNLEVVAERPISQHLEKGVVVRVPADIFEIWSGGGLEMNDEIDRYGTYRYVFLRL
jgi:hypothetical protein